MPDSQQLDLVFGALASPVRRSILDRIAGGDTTIAAIAEPFDMSLNAVSKHVKCLERASLISRKVEGKYHRISLNHDAMLEAARWLSFYVPFWRESLQSLKSHVESK